MKKNKTKYLIVTIAIIIVAILIAIVLHFTSKPNLNEVPILEITEIETLLDQHDCNLTKSSSVPFEISDYTFCNTTPEIYAFSGTDYPFYLLIYRFDNYNDAATEIIVDLLELNGSLIEEDSPIMISENSIISGKNIAILPWKSRDPKIITDEMSSEINNKLEKAFDILFEHAFNGKTTIYEGESENWKITIPVRHYTAILDNLPGRNSYAHGNIQFTYIGDSSKQNQISSISAEGKSKRSMSISDGITFDRKEGYLIVPELQIRTHHYEEGLPYISIEMEYQHGEKENIVCIKK